MQLYDGFGFLPERPMTSGLPILAAFFVVLPSQRSMRTRRRAAVEAGVADGD